MAERLRGRKLGVNPIVLGIPRGGVVVAAEVARLLSLPLDIVVTAKIGAPENPEYAIGAVAPDGEVTINSESGYPPEHVKALAGPAHEKVRRYVDVLRSGREPLELRGRSVIVVDDGLATGLTALAAVEYLRRHGVTSVIVAVPVASRSAMRALGEVSDEVVVVDVPDSFMAVGQFYRVFGQTEDSEVEQLLADAWDELTR